MSTFTNQTKNAVTLTNQTKGTSGDVIATAGLVMGMLCNSYSGGQVLVTGTLPVFTNQTKN